MKPGKTIGEFVREVLAIDTPEKAKSFFEAHCAELAELFCETPKDATTAARCNIGWCFGEGMTKERRAMWREVCDAVHPFLGAMVEDLTAEEAIRAGIEEGRRINARSRTRLRERPVYYVLDEQGHPRPQPDLGVSGPWFEKSANRVLERTDLGQLGLVSTVFLGIDHNLSGEGKPILWETMVFGGPWDGEQWRATSEIRARARHRLTVKRLSKLPIRAAEQLAVEDE